ncbi:unnamed protein product [Phaeothamnion confervicola]
MELHFRLCSESGTKPDRHTHVKDILQEVVQRVGLRTTREDGEPFVRLSDLGLHVNLVTDSSAAMKTGDRLFDSRSHLIGVTVADLGGKNEMCKTGCRLLPAVRSLKRRKGTSHTIGALLTLLGTLFSLSQRRFLAGRLGLQACLVRRALLKALALLSVGGKDSPGKAKAEKVRYWMRQLLSVKLENAVSWQLERVGRY